jgi:hypothetical protein
VETRPSVNDQSRMLLMASESAADPIVEAYPFYSSQRNCPVRAARAD